MRRKHLKIFVQGFVVVAPVLVTVYVAVALCVWLYNSVAKGLAVLGIPIPVQLAPFAPVVGIILIVAVIYLVGLVAQYWMFRRMQGVAEAVFERIPVFKSLYSAVKDLLGFLSGADSETKGVPARLNLLDGRIHMLGLVTQKRPESFLGPAAKGRVAVYLPMSYQIGGFTVYVEADRVEELEGMAVESLLKFCMTAGMGKTERKDAAAGPQDA
jgi:uncharacterized membrane protein